MTDEHPQYTPLSFKATLPHDAEKLGITAPTVEACQPSYIHNWATMQVRHDNVADRAAQAIIRHKNRFMVVQERSGGVPWWWIGCTLYRESDLNFNTYLGNGQSIYHRTTIVPKGRGPWKTFEDGAIDALDYEGYLHSKNWDVVACSYRWEKFNGFGYRYRGVNAPYLYAGSTVYGPPQARGGLFVSDGHFSSGTVDQRLGTVTILKRLLALDSSINVTLPAGGIA